MASPESMQDGALGRSDSAAADAQSTPGDRASSVPTAAGHAFGAISVFPSSAPPLVQCSPDASPEGGPLDGDLADRIGERTGHGGSLQADTRAEMERAFGTTFAAVRIHADGDADSLTRSLGARAFTTGDDIFFREGVYAPKSAQGRELLAHELTHVVQQRPVAAEVPLTVGAADDPSEREAAAIGRQVAEGQSIAGVQSSPSVKSVATARVQRDGPAGAGTPAPTAAPAPAPGGAPALAAPGGALGDKFSSSKTWPTSAKVSFGLPKDTNLGGSTFGLLYTTDYTQVSVTITESQLRLSVDPPLHIRAVSAMTPVLGPLAYVAVSDCEWSGATFDFAKGAIASIDLKDTGIGFSIQGSAREKITQSINVLLGGTPVATAGYNPLEDKDLAGTMAAVGANSKKLSSGGSGALNERDIRTTFSVLMTEPIKTEEVAIHAGTPMSLGVAWSGTAKDLADPAKRRISSLDLETGGIKLFRKKEHVATIYSATLSHGGGFRLNRWENLTGADAAGGLLGLVGGLIVASGAEGNPLAGGAAISQGAAGGWEFGATLSQTMVEQKVGPVLVQLVRTNRAIVPGLDLAALMGI